MRDYGRTSSVTDMLDKLGWRRLDLRRSDQQLGMFHGITHSLVAIPSEDYITRNTRPSHTSHDMAYKQIQTSLDVYKFSFFPRTCTIIHWNSLPANLVNLNANPVQSGRKPDWTCLSLETCSVFNNTPCIFPYFYSFIFSLFRHWHVKS